MGIPVITTDSRGCNEVVQHNVNGLILKKNSVEELRKAMLNLYESPNTMKNLSSGALVHRNAFDRRDFISEVITFFETIQLKN